MKIFLTFFVAIYAVMGADIPTFMDKCNATQTDSLSDCIITSGNKAIPHITKGVPQYNLPTMEPYSLPTFTLKDDGELRFIVRNIRVYGLERTKITYAGLNSVKDEYASNYTVPSLIALGDYEMNGTLFGRNVYGAGKYNITGVNLEMSMKMKYTVSSDDYCFIYGLSGEYTKSRMYFYLSNLYNGDRNLGDEMSKMINDNWMEMSNMIYPSMRKGYVEIFHSIYQSITDVVQWSNIFLH